MTNRFRTMRDSAVLVTHETPLVVAHLDAVVVADFTMQLVDKSARSHPGKKCPQKQTMSGTYAGLLARVQIDSPVYSRLSESAARCAATTRSGGQVPSPFANRQNSPTAARYAAPAPF